MVFQSQFYAPQAAWIYIPDVAVVVQLLMSSVDTISSSNMDAFKLWDVAVGRHCVDKHQSRTLTADKEYGLAVYLTYFNRFWLQSLQTGYKLSTKYATMPC